MVTTKKKDGTEHVRLPQTGALFQLAIWSSVFNLSMTGQNLVPAKVGKNVLSFYICYSLQKVGVEIDVKDKEAVTRTRSFDKQKWMVQLRNSLLLVPTKE